MASVKQAWINKYGEQEGLRRWKELNKGKGTIERYITKYGEKEGTRLYKEKNSKLSVSVEALKKNGKSDKEIAEIRKVHREKSKQSLKNMIERYGKKEGEVRYREYVEKNKLTSNRRLDYWINKYEGDLEKAKQALSDWQRRDKKWFIDKYGKEEGLERFYNANSKKGRTLKNYITRHGAEEGLLKYQEACRRWKEGQHGIFNSKGQVEVEEYLKSLFKNVKGSRSETGIIVEEDERTSLLQNSILYPDIIVNGKYIVRYNGDFWHANKTIFPEDTTIVPRVNKTAGDIRLLDKQKNTLYEKRGYVVINIWDSEWQADKESIKDYLINIIK